MVPRRSLVRGAVGLILTLLVTLTLPPGSVRASVSSVVYVSPSGSSKTCTASGNVAIGSASCNVVTQQGGWAAGTTISAYAVVTAISTSSWKLVVGCGHATGGTATETASAALVANQAASVNASCNAGEGYIYVYTTNATAQVTVTNLQFTVTIPDTVPPVPTSTIVPYTYPPTPSPAVGAALTSAVCGDGSETDEATLGGGLYTECFYASDALEEGLPDNGPGALCRATWHRVAISCVEGATGYWDAKWLTDNGQTGLSNIPPVPPEIIVDTDGGLTATGPVQWVRVYAWTDVHCGYSGTTCPLFISVTAKFWSSESGFAAVAWKCSHDATEEDDFICGGDSVQVPAGTTRLQVNVTCDGPGCIGINNGPFHSPSRMHVVDVRLYSALPAGDIAIEPNANLCGFGAPQPSGVECPADYGQFDPNTGGQICGPLSGDCTKGYIVPVEIGQCSTPSGLDVVGWLSFLACEVSLVPQWIYNYAVVPVVNGIIDLLVPGQGPGQVVYRFQREVGKRVPFSWVGPISSQVAGVFADPAYGDSPLASFRAPIFGADPVIGLGTMWDMPVQLLSPWRDLFVIVVRLGFVAWLFYEILGFVGRQQGNKQLTAFWDDPGPM